MKAFSTIFICLYLISCNSIQKEIPLKTHNPIDHIQQKIKDPKAKELFNKGSALYKLGNYKGAKNFLNQSLEIEKSAITFSEMAIISTSEKDYTQAIHYLKLGKEYDDKYWPIYIIEARNFIKLNEFKNAETSLLTLKKLSNSDYWISYADFYLAIIYFNWNGDCVKALNFLEKSKKLSNDNELKTNYLKIKYQIEENCS